MNYLVSNKKLAAEKQTSRKSKLKAAELFEQSVKEHRFSIIRNLAHKLYRYKNNDILCCQILK